MEHKFPLGRPNPENGTTFWAVPLFLVIFQSGEPKKRFPFSPKPEFSEFLIKGKAPQFHAYLTAQAQNAVPKIFLLPGVVGHGSRDTEYSASHFVSAGVMADAFFAASWE